MNNKQVIENWENGKRGKSGSLSTDGNNLYSYKLLIGVTKRPYHENVRFNGQSNSQKLLLNATAKGNNFYSQTTSAHVGLALIETNAQFIDKPQWYMALDMAYGQY